MKCTSSKGILILASFVSMIMLMSNASASIGPGVWMNQATLSIVDSNPSRDPENSGFGTTQVVVWEEWNGNDWDIWMKYSLADGALGSWLFPPLHPATTFNVDERNPAVTVTNANFPNGLTEIHVVYEHWNGMQWDICHTYTVNMGGLWTVPVILNMGAARDPAIVYTEEVSNPIPPARWYGMCIQIVWSEYITFVRGGANLNEIRYNAWYYDPIAGPPWVYYLNPALLPGSYPISPFPFANSEKPEIASVDETTTIGPWEYYFAIVWQEANPMAVTDIWYNDGVLNIIPGPPAATAALPGIINTNIPGAGNCYDPDIAATQDYQNPAVALEEFYFHVNWVYQQLVPAVNYRIATCYSVGPVPFPGSGTFIATGPAQVAQTILNRPTIASKLTMQWPPFTIFETWMCWEDTRVVASSPDIWYIVGQWDNMARIFAFPLPAALVPYVPPVSSDYNPELWNRNDAARMFPPFTHLVFDQSSPAGVREIVYIDP